MSRIILSLFLILTANVASAQSCPNHYRFVDFGMVGPDEVLRRGGTIFRAFDPANKHLLVPQDTVCLNVEALAKDGRSLLVPVVTGFSIDVATARLAVSTLSVRLAGDVTRLAEANAQNHQRALSQDVAERTTGDTFVCAHTPDASTVSCQIVSPYQGNVPLVVYCDAQSCNMPVLGRDEELMISATWPREASDAQTLGAEITVKMQIIHAFLEKQFSGF